MKRGRVLARWRPWAFTLVELLIVIIVIAILAAIAIPKIQQASRRSFESSLRAQLRILRDGVERFYNDTGAYPATLDDLTVSVAGGSITLPGGSIMAPGSSSGSGGSGSSGSGSSTTTTTGTTTTGTQGFASSGHDVYVMPPAVPSQFTGWISYAIASGKGRVFCPMSGTGLDGTAYSSW